MRACFASYFRVTLVGRHSARRPRSGSESAAVVARVQLDQVPMRDRMCSEASAPSTAIRLSGTLRDVRFVSRPGCRSCRHPRRGVSCTDRLSIKPFGRARPSTHFGVFVTIAAVVKAVCEVFHIVALRPLAADLAWQVAALKRLIREARCGSSREIRHGCTVRQRSVGLDRSQSALVVFCSRCFATKSLTRRRMRRVEPSL
jgi:hypothetical protein